MKKMEISGEKIEKMLKKQYRKAERAVRPAPVALPVGESGAVVRFRPSGASRMASAAAFALCGLGIVSMVILFALSGNGFGSKLKPNPVGYQPSESDSDVRYEHFNKDDFYDNGTNEGTEEFLAQLAEEKGSKTILESRCSNVTTDLIREKMGIELFRVFCGPEAIYHTIDGEKESAGWLYNGFYYVKDGKIVRMWKSAEDLIGCFIPVDFDGNGNFDLMFVEALEEYKLSSDSPTSYSSIYYFNFETEELNDFREPDGISYISSYVITPDEPFDGKRFTIWDWTYTDDLYYESGRILSENGQPKVELYEKPDKFPHLEDGQAYPNWALQTFPFWKIRAQYDQGQYDCEITKDGTEEFLAQLAAQLDDPTVLNANCEKYINDLVYEKTGLEIFGVFSSAPDYKSYDYHGYYYRKADKTGSASSDMIKSLGLMPYHLIPCDFDGDGNYDLLGDISVGSGICTTFICILHLDTGEVSRISTGCTNGSFYYAPDEPFDGKNFTIWDHGTSHASRGFYYEYGRITSENGQPKIEYYVKPNRFDLGPGPDVIPVDPNVTQPKPDPSTPQTTQPKPETTTPQTTAPKPDTSKPLTPQPTTPEPTLPPDIAALPENVLEDLDAYLQEEYEEPLAAACQVDDFKLIGHYGDCYVFLDSCGMRTDAFDRIIVDGYRFSYRNSFGILVYKNGEIYGLQRAFENGLLTHAQMGQINADYRAKVDGCMPSVWGIDMPSAELVNEIEQAWCDHRELHTALWGDDLRYYGQYGSGAVIYGWDWQAKAQTLTIADSEFELKDYRLLWYYQDGTLTELSAAYENGWLTADQIAEIAAYHANYPG